MKLNQTTTAAFLFAILALASSSLSSVAAATSSPSHSHEESKLKDKIAPLLASKPNHYLRSHRILQSSNDYEPLTDDVSQVVAETFLEYVFEEVKKSKILRPRKPNANGKKYLNILYTIFVVPVVACCKRACGRGGSSQEEEAVEPAVEEATASPAV